MYIVLGLFQSYSLNLVYFLDNDRDGGICKAKLGGGGGVELEVLLLEV
jgi:hypothetical protein